MMKHMLSSAVVAGFAVGLLVALLQFAFVEKDILLAEKYETGELVHFKHAPDHADDAVTDGAAETAAATAADATMPMDHDHMAHAVDETGSPVLRHSLTVLFSAVTYVGYALVLVSGYAIARQFGRTISVQTGLLWGLAGFMAFQMAPAMGLEPELPGTMAAALSARQAWWLMTAVATVGGLGLIGYGGGLLAWGAGLVLLAAPHVIGAPDLGTFSGVTPPELAAGFAARSLGVGLIAWVTLGGLLANLWSREPG